MELIMEFFLQYYAVIAMSILMIMVMLFTAKNKLKDGAYLFVIYSLMIIFSIAQFIDFKSADNPKYIILRYICAITTYSGRPFLIILLLWILDDRWKKTWTLLLPAIINAALAISTPFTHLYFYLTAENIFVRGPFGFTEFISSSLYGLVLMIMMAVRFKNGRNRENFLIIMCMATSVIAGVLEIISTNSSCYMTVFGISLIIFYLYIHIQTDRERELQTQLELQQKHTALMVSQIQPHFIYNTLASIRYLTKTDSEKAATTIEEFALYLRNNINSMNNQNPIPVDEELSHVETYVQIEKLRFPTIEVEYDIQDRNYDIPSLTIQPIVENAIKHGVRGVENGRVWIKTYKSMQMHYIEVSDNGVGFDPETADMHVGLENVRRRLEMMSNGTLQIESSPGNGTKITMTVEDVY